MREKELRLALICYGGVSLAVYMHGITKEVWRVARASRANTEGERPTTAVEQIYADLLAQIEWASGVRLRMLPDIIAGASAGGINGVFLAQAIATGQSLEPLTDLWLAEADVDRLIDVAARARSPLAKLWAGPLVWALARRSTRDDSDPTIRAKLRHFLRGRWFEPPFSGTTFTRLLLTALDAMAALPAGPRLLPPAQPLDLFVTVTDFHGHGERLELHTPRAVIETEHRLTLAFRDAIGAPGRIDDAAALVYAARATASFPGAFPPFTVAELDEVLAEADRDWPGRAAFLARALPDHADPAAAVLIDGSVLANAPFAPAVAALANRPAKREVDRRFVYIDPKPRLNTVRPGAGGGRAVPGFFTTLFAALSDLPREQPIRDNLEVLAQRSRDVARLRAVMDAVEPQIDAAIEALFGRSFFLDRPTPARLTAWRLRAEERAGTDAGHANAVYLQLRLAQLLGDEPALADTLAEVGLAALLDAHDLAYRRRRLRFLSRRLTQLAEDNDAYDALLDAAFRGVAQLSDLAGAIPPDGLPVFDAQVDAALADALAQLPREPRRAALFAWLGFPFVDVATYALHHGQGFDEFDAVKVDRIAPDDAQTLRQGDARATLKGVRFGSFGAFFSRAYRQNDYLWGRLHGAERMIDLLASAAPPRGAPSAVTILACKRRAFAAILDEEAERLPLVADLIASLRAELEVAAAAAGKTASDDLAGQPD